MKKSNKFSPEVRERAVRMVQEHRSDYPSLSGAVKVVAAKSLMLKRLVFLFDSDPLVFAG